LESVIVAAVPKGAGAVAVTDEDDMEEATGSGADSGPGSVPAAGAKDAGAAATYPAGT
jgi:hypothetical protein